MIDGHAPRTNSTSFFTRGEAMTEVENLRFAYAAFAEQFVIKSNRGSHEAENAKQAVLGFRHRISYLLDSFDFVFAQLDEKIMQLQPAAVARALEK